VGLSADRTWLPDGPFCSGFLASRREVTDAKPVIAPAIHAAAELFEPFYEIMPRGGRVREVEDVHTADIGELF
jgi:hypothetical protein